MSHARIHHSHPSPTIAHDVDRTSATRVQSGLEVALSQSLPNNSPQEGPSSGPGQEPGRPGEISDQEWEIRTGRAIYILQQTLPEFFTTGLVSSLEAVAEGEGESIYSPHVRLAYTPPTPLPAPFPRTLHVEGYPFYVASSVFVRHTLNALYTDLRVELRRIRVHGSRPASKPLSVPFEDLPGRTTQDHRSMRQRTLFIGLAVSGVARVSGVRGGWEVNSTYEFSPSTGLIHLHTVDSIEPAPHQAVFHALRTALGKLSLAGGLHGPGQGGVAGGDCAKRQDGCSDG